MPRSVKARVPLAVRERNAKRQVLKPGKPWDVDGARGRTTLRAAYTLVNVRYGQNGTLLSTHARLTAFCEVAADIMSMARTADHFEEAVRMALRSDHVGFLPENADKDVCMIWEAKIVAAVQMYLFLKYLEA